MENKILMLLCIVVVILFYLLVYYRNKANKIYTESDKLLDKILENSHIDQIEVNEGKTSALASKISKVQEKLLIETGRAENEKEQIKCLISNMSHQLKTPLANVIMYEDILLEKLEDPQVQKFLYKMKDQTKKIDWILNSLFKMVKLEQNALDFNIENNSVKDTLAMALTTVYEKAEKKDISIKVTGIRDQQCWHNPQWTAEVFVNILENAIKYSDVHKKISISMKTYEMYSEIGIKDFGIGIPESDQPQIFARFYRVKNVKNFEGSGIGLYLSKLIIEKENGYITVDSHIERGTCFHVFLQNCKN